MKKYCWELDQKRVFNHSENAKESIILYLGNIMRNKYVFLCFCSINFIKQWTDTRTLTFFKGIEVIQEFANVITNLY